MTVILLPLLLKMIGKRTKKVIDNSGTVILDIENTDSPMTQIIKPEKIKAIDNIVEHWRIVFAARTSATRLVIADHYKYRSPDARRAHQNSQEFTGDH